MPAEPPMPAEPHVPLVSNEATDAEPAPAAPDPPPAVEPPEASPVEEPKPDVAPEPPEPPDRAGSVTPAVQNLNLDIRILSPGDTGPVHQEGFAPGRSSDDPGGEMPSGGPRAFDWTWNWTWTETCDGSARSAAWTWNWTWCGDLHMPDIYGAPGVSDRGALAGVDDLEPVAPFLDLGGFLDDASRSVRSGDSRQLPSAAGVAAVEDDDAASRTTNSFERPRPLGAISRPLIPVTAPAPAPQPREAVSRPRERPGRSPDSPAPLLPLAAFAAAAGPPGGTAGSPAAIALLAALILLGPSLLRGFLADQAPLRPSHQSSRLERPG